MSGRNTDKLPPDIKHFSFLISSHLSGHSSWCRRLLRVGPLSRGGAEPMADLRLAGSGVSEQIAEPIRHQGSKAAAHLDLWVEGRRCKAAGTRFLIQVDLVIYNAI